MQPVLIMLAGPNGAGKSTYHRVYLSYLNLPFLNADNLANKNGLDALLRPNRLNEYGK